MKPNLSSCSTKIPEMKNVTKCYFFIDSLSDPKTSSYDAIIGAFQKMPKLRRIGLTALSVIDSNDVFQIVFRILARFPTKQFVIAIEFSSSFGFIDVEERLEEVIVVKKKDQKELGFVDKEVLTVCLVGHSLHINDVLDQVKKYLENSLEDRHAYAVKNKKR